MKERYGHPPDETGPGYYQVDYDITYCGTMMVRAANEEEAYEEVDRILADEHPDAGSIETFDAEFQYQEDDRDAA